MAYFKMVNFLHYVHFPSFLKTKEFTMIYYYQHWFPGERRPEGVGEERTGKEKGTSFTCIVPQFYNKNVSKNKNKDTNVHGVNSCYMVCTGQSREKPAGPTV